MTWDEEAAQRKLTTNNEKEAGQAQVNIKTQKAGYETIAKEIAMLYIEFITEGRIPKHGRKKIWR